MSSQEADAVSAGSVLDDDHSSERIRDKRLIINFDGDEAVRHRAVEAEAGRRF